MLVTMCRPLLSHGVLFAKSGMLSDASSAFQDWTKWVTTESWKRLVHFAWRKSILYLLDSLPVLLTDKYM